jgi:hypothetical protein
MSNPEIYQPADLDRHTEFRPALLHGKDLLIVPSQGEHDTNVIVGQEGEMLYEQRQAGEATSENPGIFASRAPLPRAEAAYLNEIFGEKNPLWKITSGAEPGVPLDQIVLAEPSFLHELGELAAERAADLYGFNQTAEMAEIADRLGIRYYGNADFAEWAGTKIGLTEFADECGVPTPATIPIYRLRELSGAAAWLQEEGYTDATIKVSHSAGAMGQTVFSLEDVVATRGPELRRFLPEEFMPHEGAVVQGWIPEGEPVSLHTFVDFDGSYTFTGAQSQLLTPDSPPGSAGAIPLDERYLEAVLATGHKLAAGYVAHRAYGPHAMDMIIPTLDACEQLGLEPGEPLCHDENTRSSAAMISRAWLLAITEGTLGVGWKDAKIKLPPRTKIADVIETLREHQLLLTKPGPDAHGVFVYNGAVLDFGHEQACYALAISNRDDPSEAAALLTEAADCLGGKVPETRSAGVSVT